MISYYRQPHFRRILNIPSGSLIVIPCIVLIVSLISINNVLASSDTEVTDSKSGFIQSEPVKWNTYENKDYGIKLQYPDNWVKLEGDLTPGDYITNIVLFKAPFDTKDEEIEKGKDFSKESRGHQLIRFAIYHPPFPLSNSQHDLDLYLEGQLNSYKQV